MPDVAAALESLPDLGARTRYLRAVLARLAQQADPLLAAAVTLAVASTPAESLAPELAPRAGIVLSRQFNTTKKPEVIEVDGKPMKVPAAVANLLREALAPGFSEADRRTVRDMERLLPMLAGWLVDTNRKGSTKNRAQFGANAALRSRITLR
jgi:hypothetical protein